MALAHQSRHNTKPPRYTTIPLRATRGAAPAPCPAASRPRKCANARGPQRRVVLAIETEHKLLTLADLGKEFRGHLQPRREEEEAASIRPRGGEHVEGLGVRWVRVRCRSVRVRCGSVRVGAVGAIVRGRGGREGEAGEVRGRGLLKGERRVELRIQIFVRIWGGGGGRGRPVTTVFAARHRRRAGATCTGRGWEGRGGGQGGSAVGRVLACRSFRSISARSGEGTHLEHLRYCVFPSERVVEVNDHHGIRLPVAEQLHHDARAHGRWHRGHLCLRASRNTELPGDAKERERESACVCVRVGVLVVACVKRDGE